MRIVYALYILSVAVGYVLAALFPRFRMVAVLCNLVVFGQCAQREICHGT